GRHFRDDADPGRPLRDQPRRIAARARRHAAHPPQAARRRSGREDRAEAAVPAHLLHLSLAAARAARPGNDPDLPDPAADDGWRWLAGTAMRQWRSSAWK